MNLILTERCNKGCSYCFANGNHNGKEDMTLETARKIIDTLWDYDSSVKLLGGEPTIAEHFKEILDYVAWKNLVTKSNKTFLLITNMLFNIDITDLIIKYKKAGCNLRLLVNATDLDVGHRFERFKANYDRFKEELGDVSFIVIGITVANNKSSYYHRKYTKRIIKEFKECRGFRVSMQFPDADTAYNPIHRYDIGNKIYTVINELIKHNRGYHLDCILLPCMFLPYQYSRIKKYSLKVKTICEGCPFDVYPNGKCLYCYPLSKSVSVETNLEEEKLLTARDILSKKVSDIPNPYLYTCIRCRYHKLGVCKGPAKCFLKENV